MSDITLKELKDDIAAIRAEMATKDDIARLERRIVESGQTIQPAKH